MKRPTYLSKHINLLFLIGLGFSIGSLNTVLVSALTYQTTTDVEFTVNPSINVSLSSNDLLISDLTPGTSSDSNIITVDVSTNAGYGYYLAATAGTSSGSTNLVNTVDSSRVFTNLSSNKASLSNFSDNTWGYSYSTDNGTNWISGNNDAATAGYNGLPLDNNDNGATGIKLASTDSYVSTNSIKFKIGAKASTTQSGGTYTNTVNFYAVANPEPQLGPVACEAGKICYNVNALTQTEGTMGRQTAPADGNSVTLLASNFSRTGYGFAGWSDTYDYTGNLYGPQEDITVPTGTSTNGLSLYAIWVPSEGYFQDIVQVASICERLTASGPNVTKTLNSVSALTDQRDNETYAIAKLADDGCWMIENLRLESTAEHNSDGTLAQGYGTSSTYGNFSGLADPEPAWANNSTSANSLYSTDGSGGTVSIGASDSPGRRMPRYNNYNNQPQSAGRPITPTTNWAINDDTDAAMFSYGNYYTWPAAVANTKPYSTNNDGPFTTSICPSGWHLPKGADKTAIEDYGFSSGYWFLVVSRLNQGVLPNNYSSSPYPYYSGSTEGRAVLNLMKSFPNNFLLSGYAIGGSLSNRGNHALYWTSTANSASGAYSLYVISNNVSPGTSNVVKEYGGSIRCSIGAS